MKLPTLFLIFILLIYVSPASSGVFDATKNLEGKTVVIAGDVEALECPMHSKYDCLSWPTGLLRFKYRDTCFVSDIGACKSFCKGFIAVGKDNIPYFFTTDFMSDDIKKNNVHLYKCPDIN